MSLRLYLDHHVDNRIMQGLRSRNCDVLTAFEDEHHRHADAELLARATELGRVVFTLDVDFLEIAADWQIIGRRFAGIVFGRAQSLSVGTAVRDLELIVQVMASKAIENAVVRIPL